MTTSNNIKSLAKSDLLFALSAMAGTFAGQEGIRAWAQPTYEKRWRSNHPYWRGYWMPHSGAKECARRLRQAAKLEERR